MLACGQHTQFDSIPKLVAAMFSSPVLVLLRPKVYKVSFWLKHYKHKTHKRTVVVSNREQIAHLDRGKLHRQNTRRRLQTSVRYQDARNRPCFKANESLKQTQPLCLASEEGVLKLVGYDRAHPMFF